jgi:peptidoglycan/xylan/chitin deacetylase (PgdA/CDA1 family)
MTGIPIITYHSVSEEVGGELGPYTLAPSLFAEHMAFLHDLGYVAYTIPDLVAALDRGAPVSPRAVAITFDDAYADFARHALPVLSRLGLVATLYVPTGYIGGESAWLGGDPRDRRPMLTAAQLRRLPDAGIACGAHSHTHAELDRLPQRLLEREAGCSRQALEDVLEKPVTSFAYPFGYYDRRVRAAVREAGYASACATGDTMASSSADRLALPRFVVKAGTSVAVLAGLLERPVSTLEHDRVRAKEVVWRMIRRLERGDGGRRRSESAVPCGRGAAVSGAPPRTERGGGR